MGRSQQSRVAARLLFRLAATEVWSRIQYACVSCEWYEHLGQGEACAHESRCAASVRSLPATFGWDGAASFARCSRLRGREGEDGVPRREPATCDTGSGRELEADLRGAWDPACASGSDLAANALIHVAGYLEGHGAKR